MDAFRRMKQLQATYTTRRKAAESDGQEAAGGKQA